MESDPQKVLEADVIERMMREDTTFMYKVQLIKDKILTNYNEYADSIASFNSDLDLEGGTSIPNTLKGGFDGLMNTMSVKFDSMVDLLGDLELDGGAYTSNEMKRGFNIVSLKLDSISDVLKDLYYDGDVNITDSLLKGFDKMRVGLDGAIDIVSLKLDLLASGLDDLSTTTELNNKDGDMQTNATPNEEGIFESDAVNVVISDINNDVMSRLADSLNEDEDNPAKTLDTKLKDKNFLRNILGGVVGLAAVLGIWGKYGDDIKKALGEGWEKYGDKIKDGVGSAIGFVGDGITSVMEDLGVGWEKYGDDITKGIHGAFVAAGTNIGGVLDTIGDAIVDSITGLTKDEREVEREKKNEDHLVSVIATLSEDDKDIDRTALKHLLDEYKIKSKGGEQKSSIKKLKQMGIDLTDAEDLYVLDEYLKTQYAARNREGDEKLSLSPEEIVRQLINDPQFQNKQYQRLLGGLQEKEYAKFFEDMQVELTNKQVENMEEFESTQREYMDRLLSQNNKLVSENTEFAKRSEASQKERDEETQQILRNLAEKPSGGNSTPSAPAVDMGEIREAAYDAVYNSRSNFYRQER